MFAILQRLNDETASSSSQLDVCLMCLDKLCHSNLYSGTGLMRAWLVNARSVNAWSDDRLSSWLHRVNEYNTSPRACIGYITWLWAVYLVRLIRWLVVAARFLSNSPSDRAPAAGPPSLSSCDVITSRDSRCANVPCSLRRDERCSWSDETWNTANAQRTGCQLRAVVSLNAVFQKFRGIISRTEIALLLSNVLGTPYSHPPQ